MEGVRGVGERREGKRKEGETRRRRKGAMGRPGQAAALTGVHARPHSAPLKSAGDVWAGHPGMFDDWAGIMMGPGLRIKFKLARVQRRSDEIRDDG
jgi:hypothetical protein